MNASSAMGSKISSKLIILSCAWCLDCVRLRIAVVRWWRGGGGQGSRVAIRERQFTFTCMAITRRVEGGAGGGL